MCENTIMVHRDNGSKLIGGVKKLNENKKAANQEKDLVSFIHNSSSCKKIFSWSQKDVTAFILICQTHCYTNLSVTYRRNED